MLIVYSVAIIKTVLASRRPPLATQDSHWRFQTHLVWSPTDLKPPDQDLIIAGHLEIVIISAYISKSTGFKQVIMTKCY